MNKLLVLALICTLYLTLMPPAYSQEYKPFVLNHLIFRLRENNPELKAALHQWKAMQYKVTPSSALPDPQLLSGLRNVGFDSFSLGKEMMSNLSLMATQKIPFPTKLQIKEALSIQQVIQAQLNYYNKEQHLITALKQLYLKLYYNNQAINVISHTLELLKQFQKTAEVKYSVGKVPQQDIFKAQVEISHLTTRLIQLESKQKQVVVKIERLIGEQINSNKIIPNLSELNKAHHFDHQILQTRLIKHSPSLSEKKSKVESSRLNTVLAFQNYYPDFTLSGSYLNRAVLDAIWEFKIGVTLPIYITQKQTPQIEAAKKMQLATQAIYASHRLELLEKLENALITYKTEQKLFKIYRNTIIPQAKRAFDASLAGYIGDKVDFLTVLSNLKSLFNEELSAFQRETAYHRALTKIEELIAKDIYFTPGDTREKK